MLPLVPSAVFGVAPILRFSEATTRVPVTLVGVMHYNPHSINLVRTTIADEPSLSAVCVELCDARWNATVASKWRADSLERWFFEDECQAAFEASQANSGVGVLLAHQPIGTTFSRVRELMGSTCTDVLSVNGWRRIAHDVRVGIDDVLIGEPSEEAPSLLYALDLPLLLNAPLALLRYLLSSPPVATLLMGALIMLNALVDEIAVDDSIISVPERLAEFGLVLAVGMVALRVVLVALVVERNDALAANIRSAARVADGRDAGAAAGIGGDERIDASVVGVLGLVHVRGVRRRLLATSRTADGGDNALVPTTVPVGRVEVTTEEVGRAPSNGLLTQLLAAAFIAAAAASPTLVPPATAADVDGAATAAVVMDGFDEAIMLCPDERVTCVSSYDERHFVEPWEYDGTREEAIQRVSAAAAGRFGGVVTRDDSSTRGTALRVTFPTSRDSAIFWFPVDDFLVNFRSERTDGSLWDGAANKVRLDNMRKALGYAPAPMVKNRYYLPGEQRSDGTIKLEEERPYRRADGRFYGNQGGDEAGGGLTSVGSPEALKRLLFPFGRLGGRSSPAQAIYDDLGDLGGIVRPSSVAEKLY